MSGVSSYMASNGRTKQAPTASKSTEALSWGRETYSVPQLATTWATTNEKIRYFEETVSGFTAGRGPYQNRLQALATRFELGPTAQNDAIDLDPSLSHNTTLRKRLRYGNGCSIMGTIGSNGYNWIQRCDHNIMGMIGSINNGYDCIIMGNAASTNGYECNAMGTTVSTNGYGCNVMGTAAATDGHAKDYRESCWYKISIIEVNLWAMMADRRPNDSFTCYLFTGTIPLLVISLQDGLFYPPLFTVSYLSSLYRSDYIICFLFTGTVLFPGYLSIGTTNMLDM